MPRLQDTAYPRFLLAMSGVATLAQGLEATFAVAAVMWVVVAVAAVASGRRLSRQPLRARMA